ncbi:hypothetical protein TNCV_934801 [Trichonephila clavipes]|nr:hypothetical protein TNCV_934801 [Trichonephila clavipes]
MIVQFRNEKVSNHGSIPITIDCNVVAFIVFEENFQHVNVCGNEVLYGLAREGSQKGSTHSGCLTFPEISTQDIRSSWRQAPVQERYEGNLPGSAFLETSTRRDETDLARFHSGYNRAQRHVEGFKIYPPLPSELQCDPNYSCRVGKKAGLSRMGLNQNKSRTLKPNATKDTSTPYKELMPFKSVETQSHPDEVVWKFGKGLPAYLSSS